MNRTTKDNGMTVNERLFHAGLLDAFDRAARDRDRPKLITLLQQVKLSEKQAKFTADTLLAHPDKYGY